MNNIKLSGLSIEQTYQIIPEGTILLGYVGSIAHGTHIPKNDPNSIDDIDLMGVCIPSIDNYFGLKHFEQKEVKKDVWDSVVYEVKKFFKLLSQQNPNVLGLLWLEEKDYVYKSALGQKILDNRNLFVSKQAYHPFIGYSKAQLHKMTHFGDAKQAYMGEKRYELVQQYGYDTKNAGHLIRLLRMGIEFLTEGKLYVFRKDRDELKEIKQGKWSLEKVTKEAERLFVLAEEAYVRSQLPIEIDKEKVNKLLVEILTENFNVRT